jgi:hypothetical protein
MAALAVSAQADSAKTLGWEDLLPTALIDAEVKAATLQNDFDKLTPELRARYHKVGGELLVLEKLESGLITEEELNAEDRQLLIDKPGEANPEAVAFWAKVNAARAELEALGGVVDDKYDGQRVRIPGYALPLEFDGEAVSEFLLVPFVGACIHTPPPPPNQIVFIETSEPFASDGLFVPVWVEGILAANHGVHDLSLVDGRAPIDTGYRIEGASVAPYKEDS